MFELLEESKRIVARQEKLVAEIEKEFSPPDFPEKAEELLTPKQAKKRKKKGKKSLHRVRVDNARRRGR